MSSKEAEALIKQMDQELILQRAKLASSGGASATGNTGRWLALLGMLFLILAALAWGFWSLGKIQSESPKPATPASTKAKK